MDDLLPLFQARFPAEIRNRIYEATLVDELYAVDITAEFPGLIGTCKQIRNESLAIYYHCNTFAFEPTRRDHYLLLRLHKWLTWIGPVGQQNLRHLRIVLNGDANGALICDPNGTADCWVALVAQMNASGCGAAKVEMRLADSWKWSTAFRKNIVEAASAVEAQIWERQSRRQLQSLSNKYLKILRLQEQGSKVLEEWTASDPAHRDLVRMARKLIWATDRERTWDGRGSFGFGMQVTYSDVPREMRKVLAQDVNTTVRSRPNGEVGPLQISASSCKGGE